MSVWPEYLVKKQHLISLAIFVTITAWMMVPRSGPVSAEIPETAEREVQLVAAGAPASENPDVLHPAEASAQNSTSNRSWFAAAPWRAAMFR